MHETTFTAASNRWQAAIELGQRAAPALARLRATGSVWLTQPRQIGRPCPVCNKRIVLHVQPYCEHRPVPRARAARADRLAFADLWDTTVGRRAAWRVVTTSVVAAMLLLPGCATLPVDAVEYEQVGDDYRVRVEFAQPVRRATALPEGRGYAK